MGEQIWSQGEWEPRWVYERTSYVEIHMEIKGAKQSKIFLMACHAGDNTLPGGVG
jgi:hypothetical protein